MAGSACAGGGLATPPSSWTASACGGPWCPCASWTASRLDLQVRLRTMGWAGIDVDLFFDVLNVFDWRVAERQGSYRSSVYRLSEGRWWRMGLQHRY